jgi:hypothetical protein
LGFGLWSGLWLWFGLGLGLWLWLWRWFRLGQWLWRWLWFRLWFGLRLGQIQQRRDQAECRVQGVGAARVRPEDLRLGPGLLLSLGLLLGLCSGFCLGHLEQRRHQGRRGVQSVRRVRRFCQLDQPGRTDGLDRRRAEWLGLEELLQRHAEELCRCRLGFWRGLRL